MRDAYETLGYHRHDFDIEDATPKREQAEHDTACGGKPEAVQTSLLTIVIVPDMIGSFVGVHNGEQYTNIEVKPEMVGLSIGELHDKTIRLSCSIQMIERSVQ